MTERRRIVVSGQVQGVSFRDETRRQAEDAGVAGWVRNLDDGRVEAVLEGPGEAIERVVAFCRSGPSGAQVDDVSETDEPPEGLSGFDVR